jgi:hypothetical protein
MASNDRQQPLRHLWTQCIRVDPHMTGSTLLVLLVAASYGNLDGSAIRVGVGRLADDTGMSDRTVRYAMAAGVKAGYLHLDRRGRRQGHEGKPSEYRLSLPFPSGNGLPAGPVDNAFPSGNGLPAGSVPKRQFRGSQAATDDFPSGNGLQQTSIYQEDQPQRPAWCGRCDERTRLIEDEDTRRPRRCNVCHPLRAVS